MYILIHQEPPSVPRNIELRKAYIESHFFVIVSVLEQISLRACARLRSIVGMHHPRWAFPSSCCIPGQYRRLAKEQPKSIIKVPGRLNCFLSWCISWKMKGQNSKIIAHSMWVVTPSPLPPHPLIQIRLEISSSYPFPLFLWKFKLTPSGFHLLRVNTSDRIYKVVRILQNVIKIVSLRLLIFDIFNNKPCKIC